MTSDPAREPIFNAPAIIVALVGVCVAIHLVREVIGETLDEWLVETLAFIPARYGGAAAALPGGVAADVGSFLTHTFLHGNWMHLAINSAWLLAVGSPIARRTSAAGFLTLYFLSGAGGALLFLLFHLGQPVPMVGASGAISGLMAATMRLVFAAERPEGRLRVREEPEAAPRLSLGGTLKSRQALIAIGAWVAVNLLFGLVLSGDGPGSPGAVAWEAHLGGFLVGLVAFDLVDRGPEVEQPA